MARTIFVGRCDACGKHIRGGDKPHTCRGMIDLSINRARSELDQNLARIEHWCGCYSYWDRNRNGTGNWLTAIDSPWRVCAEHRAALTHVERPTFEPMRGQLGTGYRWVDGENRGGRRQRAGG